MKKMFLVLTKKKSFGNFKNKVYLSKFYCGYDQDYFSENDLLIEENLTDHFFYEKLPKEMDQFIKIMLNSLHIELNKLQELTYSKAFWEKILIVWLQKITYNLLCKYYRLVYLCQRHELNISLSTILLDIKDRIILHDITDYCLDEHLEKYDFQLWSKIIETFFYKQIHLIRYEKYLNEVVDDRFKYSLRKGLANRNQNWKKRIWGRLKTIESMLIQKKYRNIKQYCLRLFWGEFYNNKKVKCYLYYPGFQSELFDEIIMKNKKNICAMPFKITNIKYATITPNLMMRKQLKQNLKPYFLDAVQMEMMEILVDEMPLCFLENFKPIRAQYKNFLESDIQYIITQHGYFTNTNFLFYAAEMQETKNVKLMGIQHGGNYELIKLKWNDIQLTNSFYIWGNKDVIDNVKAIPSAPYKLETYSKSENRQILSKEKEVLFVGTAFPPYLVYLDRQNLNTINKIDSQIRFFSRLSLEVKKNMIIREFNYEYGWNIEKILSRRLENLQFDREIGKIDTFMSRLKRSSLCICDHLGTTWLEALAIGKPFILFFEKNAYDFLVEEKPYLKMMEDVKIIHFTPESAADTINSIYNDIDIWWNENKRMKVINTIRYRYWNDFGDPNEWWLKEISKLVNNSNIDV